MTSELFPTITAAHWRLSIARSRSEGNAWLAQIRAGVEREEARRLERERADTLTAAGRLAEAGRLGDHRNQGGQAHAHAGSGEILSAAHAQQTTTLTHQRSSELNPNKSQIS